MPMFNLRHQVALFLTKLPKNMSYFGSQASHILRQEHSNLAREQYMYTNRELEIGNDISAVASSESRALHLCSEVM